jgi:hypothetical protein
MQNGKRVKWTDHVCHVVPEDEGALEECPHREVGDVLVVGHPAVTDLYPSSATWCYSREGRADLEHVEIIPFAWAGFLSQRSRKIDDPGHGAVYNVD